MITQSNYNNEINRHTQIFIQLELIGLLCYTMLSKIIELILVVERISQHMTGSNWIAYWLIGLGCMGIVVLAIMEVKHRRKNRKAKRYRNPSPPG